MLTDEEFIRRKKTSFAVNRDLVIIIKIVVVHKFSLSVIPAEAGIRNGLFYWIPTFVGMTKRQFINRL
jgi:hypothetical protein